MSGVTLLLDAFGRIRSIVGRVTDGLRTDVFTARLDPSGNSIAWLLWHLTRIQDDHIATITGKEQVWISQDWVGRFDLAIDPSDTGYGHGTEEVAELNKASIVLIKAYHEAVSEETIRFITGLSDSELDRIVDESYEPPVSLGVRLVSITADNLQHAGQAAFLRGTLDRTLDDQT